MLSNSELEDLGKELNGLSVLQEDEVLDGLLRAGIYAKHRLYTEAADAYRKALSGEPAPVIYVTLGDAYRAASVYQLAYESYSRALALTPKMEACAATEEATTRAAAEYGLGQVLYARGKFRDDATHLQDAANLYACVGSEAEAAAARKASEEAVKRSR